MSIILYAGLAIAAFFVLVFLAAAIGMLTEDETSPEAQSYDRDMGCLCPTCSMQRMQVIPHRWEGTR